MTQNEGCQDGTLHPDGCIKPAAFKAVYTPPCRRRKPATSERQPRVSPFQVALLVSAAIMLVSWHCLMDALARADPDGWGLLAEVALILAGALAAGGVAIVVLRPRRRTARRSRSACDDSPRGTPALGVLSEARSSDSASSCYGRIIVGDGLQRPTGAPAAAAAGVAPVAAFDTHDDENDDVKDVEAPGVCVSASKERHEATRHDKLPWVQLDQHVENLGLLASNSSSSSSGRFSGDDGSRNEAMAASASESQVPAHARENRADDASASLQLLLRATQQLQACDDLSAASQQLFTVVDRLLYAPEHTGRMIDAGGLDAVRGVVRRVQRELDGVHGAGTPDTAAACLQASWLLVLVATGPDAAAQHFAESGAVETAVALLRSLQRAASQAAARGAHTAAMRNLCWALAALCDARPARPSPLLAPPLAQQQQQLLPSSLPAPFQHPLTSVQPSHQPSHQRSPQPCSPPAQLGHMHADLTSACMRKLLDTGALPLLGELVGLRWGAEPAAHAAAVLAAAVCSGCHPGLEEVQSEAQDQLLQPDPLYGLYMLLRPPGLSGRCRERVLSCVHYLLTYSPAQFLERLVEQHLLGSFVVVLPSEHSHLLLCTALSSSGQAVLSDIDAAFELDVPLALAQLLPLSCHFLLPLAPATAAASPWGFDSRALHVHTHALACRLLLLGGRLQELLTAFMDDVAALDTCLRHSDFDDRRRCSGGSSRPNSCSSCSHPSSTDGSTSGSSGSCAHNSATVSPRYPADVPTDVICSVVHLVAHLLEQGPDLDPLNYPRTFAVDDEGSSSGSNISASSGGSSAAAENILRGATASRIYGDIVGLGSSCTRTPDQEVTPGEYSGPDNLQPLCAASTPPDRNSAAEPARAGRQGMEASELIYSDNSFSSCMTAFAEDEPGLSRGPAAAASMACSPLQSSSPRIYRSSNRVVFSFGPRHCYSIARATFRKLRRSSRFMSSLLSRTATGGGGGDAIAITHLRVPYFSEADNCWVLACLEAWLVGGQLSLPTPRRVLQLWIAADFLQVDGLMTHCEDDVAQRLSTDPSALPMTLEVCCQHRGTSGRLQQLCMRHLVCGLAETAAADCVPPAEFRDAAAAHRALLQRCMHSELRNRLVAICSVGGVC